MSRALFDGVKSNPLSRVIVLRADARKLREFSTSMTHNSRLSARDSPETLHSTWNLLYQRLVHPGRARLDAAC